MPYRSALVVQVAESLLLAVAGLLTILEPSDALLELTTSRALAALLGCWLLAAGTLRVYGLLCVVPLASTAGLYSAAAVLAIFGVTVFTFEDQKGIGLLLVAFGLHLYARVHDLDRIKDALAEINATLLSLRR